MTVLSGQTIRRSGIISPCDDRTVITLGQYSYTYGLGPAGYDLRLDLGNNFDSWQLEPGDFYLAAAMEFFKVPNDIMGFVYDKSSWARRGLSLFNTVIEPGWRGYLTLEIKNAGKERVFLQQGIPIAHVVFQRLDEATLEPYAGKYQDQRPGPQGAI